MAVQSHPVWFPLRTERSLSPLRKRSWPCARCATGALWRLGWGAQAGLPCGARCPWVHRLAP
eukprot:2150659-Alexandrium_andersonii.AAC.1